MAYMPLFEKTIFALSLVSRRGTGNVADSIATPSCEWAWKERSPARVLCVAESH